MPRYRLLIAYDGTGFHGWQRQEPRVAAEDVHAIEDEQERAARAPEYDRAVAPFLDREGVLRTRLRTVQGVVEEAVRAVVREPVMLVGASRTDAGVHARGQVAAFTCSPLEVVEEGRTRTFEDSGPASGPSAQSAEILPPDNARVSGQATASSLTPDARRGAGWPLSRGADRLAMAINSRLPEDVQVLSASHTHPNFDPISDAKSKGYSYTFHVGREKPLWDRAFVRHVRHGTLSVDAMREAAAVLVGEHDFAAFAAAGHGRLSTVRTVHALDVREIEEAGEAGNRQSAFGTRGAPRVRIDISGSGFLWNMVRIIAGTLLEVGLGRRTSGGVRAALESRDRTKAGPTVGAEGLCLEWIRYD